MERVQFGKPLARQQLMQYKMGDMLSEIAYGLEGQKNSIFIFKNKIYFKMIFDPIAVEI